MSNKILYKQICEQRPDIPVFLQHWWMDAVCQNWGVSITTDKTGNATGVWPYPIEKKLGVSLLRNPKLTPYSGPYALLPSNLAGNKADRQEYEIISQLISQLPTAKMWHLSLQPGLKQAGIFKNNGLQINARQTFLIDLSQQEQTIFSNIKDNTRRDINNPGEGITITHEPDQLAALYEFQKHTLSKKQVGQHYTFQDMQRLMAACNANNACSFLVARRQGAIIAIVWNVWDAKRSYYFMGGQNPEITHHKVTPGILWEAIKNARQRGNKWFDFEGSMDTGVERFFNRFGGTRELYLVLRKNTSWLWQLKELIRG